MDWKLVAMKAVPAAAVSLMFIVYQWLCARRLQRQCAAMTEMLERQDLPARGSEVLPELSWLRWMNDTFARNGEWLSPAPLPREAAADSLDHELWRNPDYLKLQRLGVAAPLIGVILSGAGFILFPALERILGQPARPAGSDRSPTEILTQLAPLFLGVVVGAGLALLNQFSMHRASTALSRLRMTALRWFDRSVWSVIQGRCSQPMSGAAGALSDAAPQLRDATQILSDAHSAYSNHLRSLGAQIELVEKNARFAADKFKEQSESMTAMTMAVRTSISQLQNLETAADAVNESSKSLQGTTASINKSAQDMEAASGAIRRVFANLETMINDFSQRWNESMDRALTSTTVHLEKAAGNLAQPIDSFGASASLLRENVEHLNEYTQTVNSATKQSIELLQSQAKTAAEGAHKAQKIKERAVSLTEAEARLADAIEKLQSASVMLEKQALLIGDWDGATHALAGLAEAAGVSEEKLRSLDERMGGFDKFADAEKFAAASDKLHGVVQKLTHELQAARERKKWVARWLPFLNRRKDEPEAV